MRPSFSSTTLKWIGIVAMIADHVAMMFFLPPTASLILMTIGKIAAPIMIFLVTEGFRHTSDLEKYMKRLLIAGLASQIPYSIFINRGKLLPFCANIMFTLLLSLAALYVYEKEDSRIIRWSKIFAILMVSYLSDWGIFGPLMALSFGIFQKKSAKLIAYLLVNAIKVGTIYLLYGRGSSFTAYALSPVMVAAILGFYNEKSGVCRYRWLFYAIYPIQFICIYGVWIVTGGH